MIPISTSTLIQNLKSCAEKKITKATVQEMKLHQKKWNEVNHTEVRAVLLVHFTNYCKENIIFPHGYHVPHPVNCKASALFFSLQQKAQVLSLQHKKCCQLPF